MDVSVLVFTFYKRESFICFDVTWLRLQQRPLPPFYPFPDFLRLPRFFFCFHLPPAFNICHLPCRFFPFSFLLFSPHFPPTCNSLPLLCMSSYFKDRRTCHLLHHQNATRNPAISRCFGWMQINIFAKLTMEIIYFCTFNSDFWHYTIFFLKWMDKLVKFVFWNVNLCSWSPSSKKVPACSSRDCWLV